MSDKPKIFVFVNGQAPWGDLEGIALAEDGTVLAGHASSSLGWCEHDMGVTGAPFASGKLAKYAAHYPDGYELVNLVPLGYEESPSHPGLAAAIARNTAVTPSAGEPE